MNLAGPDSRAARGLECLPSPGPASISRTSPSPNAGTPPGLCKVFSVSSEVLNTSLQLSGRLTSAVILQYPRPNSILPATLSGPHSRSVRDTSEPSKRAAPPAVERSGHRLTQPHVQTVSTHRRQHSRLSGRLFTGTSSDVSFPGREGRPSHCPFAQRSVSRHPSQFPVAHRPSAPHPAKERLTACHRP